MKYSELMESDTTEIVEKKFSDLPDYDELLLRIHIVCMFQELTSLSGSPEIVYGNFDCSGNKLKTLIGGPISVRGEFDFLGNSLTNLIGAPEIVGDLKGGSYRRLSLTGITTKQINGNVTLHGEVTGLMELWKIKGIKSVQLCDMPEIQVIVNRHMYNPRGKLAFQAEMISSGFKEYL